MEDLNKPFLKWWVQFVCSIFAIVVFFELGWLHALYNADITKISMLILTVFISTQILIGYMSKYTQVVKSKTLLQNKDVKSGKCCKMLFKMCKYCKEVVKVVRIAKQL